MNATEAAILAREHLNDIDDVSPDLGFETLSITNTIDDDWYVKCRVFSVTFSKMIDCGVPIHGGKVQCVGLI